MSTKQSQRPLGETILGLLEEEGISQRELARRVRRHGWGSLPAVNMLITGKFAPTIEAMEAIAIALAVPAETFAEYRLAVARRDLDPAKVGLSKALRNLLESR